MRKNVLIIPSWLSLKGIKGSFFREQADILNDRFDMRFLYGVEKKYNFFRALKLILKFKTLFCFKKFEEKSTYYLFDYPSFNFLSIAFNHKIKKKFYKENLIRIMRVDKFQPDLIHGQSTFDGGIISLYISIVFQLPYIITEHNLFLLHNVDEIRKKESVMALENASHVLVVSYDKARQILMHNISIKPIVIGNMINDKLFNYQPKREHSEFVILIVGHFSFIKDYDTFFEAMRILKEISVARFKIICLGYNAWNDTDNTDRISSLAKSYDVFNVSFIGIVDRSKINEYYWNADLFVLTSIAEGLPISVLEALACGTPVFSTHCGGVEDVINNDNGRLVPIKDAASLAKEINLFFEEKLKFDNEKISENILSKYSSKVFADNLSKVYNDSISSNNKA